MITNPNLPAGVVVTLIVLGSIGYCGITWSLALAGLRRGERTRSDCARVPVLNRIVTAAIFAFVWMLIAVYGDAYPIMALLFIPPTAYCVGIGFGAEPSRT